MSKLPTSSEFLDKKVDYSTPLKANVHVEDLIAYNNHVMGEVLTLIDSSIPESTQQKALKSLIKQSMWRAYNEVWEWMNEVRRIEDGNKDGSGQTNPQFPFYDTRSLD